MALWQVALLFQLAPPYLSEQEAREPGQQRRPGHLWQEARPCLQALLFQQEQLRVRRGAPEMICSQLVQAPVYQQPLRPVYLKWQEPEPD